MTDRGGRGWAAILRSTPAPPSRRVGCVLVVAFAVFIALGALHRIPDRPLLGAGAAVAAVVAAGLTQLGPSAARLPAAAATIGSIAVLANGDPASLAWFGLPMLAGFFALWTSLPSIVAVVGASIALVFVELIATKHDPGWAAWIGGTLFSTAGCVFARRQHDLVEQLHEAQAGLEQRVQAEERNRIARELHDVIAHSLTVSLLHVSSARLALDDNPADAAWALAEAERLGRASLDEVRHAVGLLRRPDSPDPRSPLPGSTDVPALVERFRRAGSPVEAEISGRLDTLPATVGLATHRILQEALTNATKHAANQPTRVRLVVDAATVCLDVDSAGTPGDGAGHGLVSMRERAQAVGGTLSAGPGGHGWLVSARLPVGTRG